MVNKPSVPEIITVNSEVLQTQIRDLLPSQNGFGSELQASNVITPIIDLTATAEGSGLPQFLQTALAFGSQTEFTVANTSTTLANSPGFYRIVGSIDSRTSSSTSQAGIQLTDGATTKDVYALRTFGSTSTPVGMAVNVDLIVWLAAGESVIAISDDTKIIFVGSIRQVADSSGTLVQPSGYPL